MVQMTSQHVFISYSRKDATAMQRIIQHLRDRGIKAWVDHESLTPGTPVWEYEIEKAIRAAFAVVVILSPDAKNSEWVLREITLADEYQKRVFPVIVSGSNVDSIPFRLVTRQFADIRQGESKGLGALSDAITSYWDLLVSVETNQAVTDQKAEDTVSKDVAHVAEEEPVETTDTRKTTANARPISSNAPVMSASSIAILWIVLGWAIGGAIGGALYFANDTLSDTVGQAIGGGIAWACGGFAFARMLEHAHAEQTKTTEITLIWAIAGALGWALGEIFTEASGAAFGVAIGAIVAMVMTSRMYPIFSNWQAILWISLILAIGGAIGWSISKGVQEAEGFVSQFYIGKIAGWAIGRAIGGVIGALGIVWQMRTALTNK